MNQADLQERRLSLLEQIAEAANEIKRIDNQLQKPITEERDRDAS